MKILLVDDDLTVLEIIGSLLAQRMVNCQVVTVVDGLEFLEQVESQTFDLIITDINMPCLDGVSAANIMTQLQIL